MIVLPTWLGSWPWTGADVFTTTWTFGAGPSTNVVRTFARGRPLGVRSNARTRGGRGLFGGRGGGGRWKGKWLALTLASGRVSGSHSMPSTVEGFGRRRRLQ